MTIQQLRKELAGIRKTQKPRDTFENIIIYDHAKGIPTFNGDKIRIFIPEDGRDQVRIYLPDNGRDLGIMK